MADRKRITGTVHLTASQAGASQAGGFYVSLQSFQADRKDHTDNLSVFTDADGAFAVNVLPDATYCVFANDSKRLTNTIDLIPYQSTAGKITNPELKLTEGQQVEVLVTTGLDRRPYPNVRVSFHSEHRYSWFEGKEKRNGAGGRGWFATTDALGRIQTPANVGKLGVSVYTPLWQTRESYDVSMGQPTKITLHREVEARRKLQVQLLRHDGLDAKLDDASITIGALGGSSRDNQTLKSDSKGAFVFETLASPVGVFACTKDGQAAGMRVFTEEQEGMLKLRRTLSFSGQLIGENDKPMVGVKVEARVLLEGKKANEENIFVSSSFEAMRKREILEKDYVMLKLDDYADENGVSVAKRLTQGGHYGIPFSAIFDSEEKMVVDSNSPLGNVGYPSGYEGSKHIRKMLLATRNSITDAEVEKLVASLAE